jgi:hypothetical protein
MQKNSYKKKDKMVMWIIRGRFGFSFIFRQNYNCGIYQRSVKVKTEKHQIFVRRTQKDTSYVI